MELQLSHVTACNRWWVGLRIIVCNTLAAPPSPKNFTVNPLFFMLLSLFGSVATRASKRNLQLGPARATPSPLNNASHDGRSAVPLYRPRATKTRRGSGTIPAKDYASLLLGEGDRNHRESLKLTWYLHQQSQMS